VTRRAPTVAAAGILAAAALLSSAPAAQAQESIRSYDIYIDVRQDASIVVTEQITVRAEGDEIRRGIYRDFPTRYRDRYGNDVRVGLEVRGVERDGAREAWFTESLSDGVRINTGGDDYLPQLPADYTFTIRYRTTRQIGFFDSHDELYWNAIGTGWIFPIQSGTVTVRLPQGVPVDRLHAEGYTGPQGAKGQAYTARIPVAGHAVYELTAPLSPHEGFTIVLTFPKGIVAAPTAAQRTRWFFSDNAGVLVAIAGLIALLAFATMSWWRVGRDPRRGIIIPRYEPPEAHSPSALRYMRRMNYDMRCFSADLLGLAVAGHLRMRQEGTRPGSAWQIERVDPPASPIVLAQSVPGAGGAPGGAVDAAGGDPDGIAGGGLGAGSALGSLAAGGVLLPGAFGASSAARAGTAWGPAAAGAPATPTPTTAATRIPDIQRTLLDRLFPGGPGRIEIGRSYSPAIGEAVRLHRKALDDAFEPRYLQRHGKRVGVAILIVIATAMTAFSTSDGAGVGAITLVLALMVLSTIMFAALVKAPTLDGRRLLDEIEGLRLYLTVAEREVLKRMQGPAIDLPRVDPARFEALLPYAMALEVEEAWTRKFTDAVGAAAVAETTQRMTWYSGRGGPGDIGSLTRSLGSGFTSSISASSSPPGSSSGGGGGGSSGGGGGGGGGGGR
jgi:uncharacterized membrane protein YgcG